MTILFITHYAGFYGANKSLLSLMLGLRNCYGITPVVLLPDEGAMCEQLIKSNIKYQVSHYYWWVNDNKGFLQWILNKRKQWINNRRIRYLCQLVSAWNPDLVYTNSICINIGVFMAERMRIPHVWQARESLQQFGFKLSVSLRQSQMVWNNPITKRYILISDYMMDAYRFYMPNDRMRRVYNGIDLPSGTNREENLVERDLHAVMLGVINKQKNQKEAVEALCIYEQTKKPDAPHIHLHLIGATTEPYTSELLRLANDYNIGDFIHVEGHCSNVFDCLQKMNIGIMASQNEAFGRVSIEYMLMKMPVIASKSGANTELVQEGKNGMIYKLGQPKQLLDCLLKYANNHNLIKEHGLFGEIFAKENFSEKKNVAAIWEIIQETLN